jgi:hypothetical protein
MSQNDKMGRATTCGLEEPAAGDGHPPQRRQATDYRAKPLNRLVYATRFLAAPALALDNTHSEALPLR